MFDTVSDHRTADARPRRRQGPPDGPLPVDIHVGRRIRALRKARGVTQVGLADAIGVTFQQVQKYERGANRVSASKLFDIAGRMNTPIAWFFEGLETTGHSAPDAGLADALMAAPRGREMAEAFLDLSPEFRASLLTIAGHLRTVGQPAVHTAGEGDPS